MNIDIEALVRAIIISIQIAFVGAEVFIRGCRYTICEKMELKSSKFNYFAFCFILLSVSYGIVFLAYWPGIFSYDADAQMYQYIFGYNTHHPLIHTLCLHFFYYGVGSWIGSYTKGVALGCFAQMMFFSGTIAYMHTFLLQEGVKKWIRVLLIIGTSILPFYSMLSISMTKDTMFSCFVLLFIVFLYYWEKKNCFFDSHIHIIEYILIISFVILFRNNGLFVVVGAMFGALIKHKNKSMKFLFYTGVGIIVTLLFSGALQTVLDAQKGSSNEALSMPYQQLAYTYHKEDKSLSNDEKKEIEEIIPFVSIYNPQRADEIKGTATGNQNYKNLIRVYCRYLKQYPFDYIQAFLQHNIGYYYVNDYTFASIYGDAFEGRQGIFLTDTEPDFAIEHKTYFQALETYYEKLFSANEYFDNLLLRYLLSPAVYLWTLLGVIGKLIIKRRGAEAMVFALLFYIVTLLAGPCVLIRYALPYIVCIPVLMVAAERDIVKD